VIAAASAGAARRGSIWRGLPSPAGARLYRAYLLKEQLRRIYWLPAAQAIQLLERWLK
jgi:hypothetical protein